MRFVLERVKKHLDYISYKMPLKKLIAHLESLERDVVNTFDAQLPNMLNIVTDEQINQLNDGLNADGDLLEKNDGIYYPYAPSYTAYKRARGGKVDRVDLKLTGAFHRGTRTYKTGKLKANITSINSKTTKLKTEFDKIFGLSPVRAEKAEDRFRPELIKIVKSKITSK